jgi:hypothetical protein
MPKVNQMVKLLFLKEVDAKKCNLFFLYKKTTQVLRPRKKMETSK